MAWFERCTLLAAICLAAAGCGNHNWFARHGQGAQEPALPNPVIIPVGDREFLWNQLVDTIDNYFRIAHEERLRLIGGTVTAGRIDTYPTVGSSIFEPWRKDSTHGFEQLHATFQSIRRRAIVNVVPAAQGYSVEVVVLKELEDLDRPEEGAVGVPASRHDGTVAREEQTPLQGPMTLGWIPIGRDLSLEQRILDELYGRVSGT